MLLRRALTSVALAVASLGVLTSASAAPHGQETTQVSRTQLATQSGTKTPTDPATAPAAPGRDDTISAAEYRAVEKGMTRPQLDHVTHGATYTTDRQGRCTLRFYRGWDRRHANVGVLMGPAHRVFSKLTWRRNEGFSTICPASLPALPALPRLRLPRGLGAGLPLH